MSPNPTEPSYTIQVYRKNGVIEGFTIDHIDENSPTDDWREAVRELFDIAEHVSETCMEIDEDDNLEPHGDDVVMMMMVTRSGTVRISASGIDEEEDFVWINEILDHAKVMIRD